MTRIYGICERAASRADPLGPDAIVPETVPASISFSDAHFIGMAALRREANGDIWAEVPDVQADPRMLGACPFFSVGAVARPGEAPVITRLAICERNIDPDLPPFTVTP